MVCHAEKQEKPFWFSSLDQIVQFGAIIFCRTFKNYFGQFVWIEKKSHYNSRVSLHEAPTKNRRPRCCGPSDWKLDYELYFPNFSQNMIMIEFAPVQYFTTKTLNIAAGFIQKKGFHRITNTHEDTPGVHHKNEKPIMSVA